MLAAFTLTTYVVGHAYCAFMGTPSREQLIKRLGKLCLINMTPLFLGGRTSYLVDKGLGVGLSNYYFMHRWVGRVCLIHGLSHRVLRAIDNMSRVGGVEIAVSKHRNPDMSTLLTVSKLLATCSAVAFLSFVYIRRKAYELFLLLHICAAPAILVLIWIHVSARDRLFYGTAGTCVGLWATQKIIWLLFLLRRNRGITSSSAVTIRPHRSGIIEVAIRLRRSFCVRPGQYIYISLPHTRSLGLGYLESHPFYITWQPVLVPLTSLSLEPESRAEKRRDPPTDIEEPASRYVNDTIILHVQEAQGFTRRIAQSNVDGLSIIVDGPYGRQPALDRFDKVLFLASGIGIAAQLLHVRHLVEAHNAKTARARRITICWFLQRDDQHKWAEDYLNEIFQLDIRDIVVMHTYKSDSYIISKRGDWGDKKDHVLPYEVLDISSFFELEYSSEAGNMAICCKFI